MNVFIPNCSTIPYALSCPASVIALAARDYEHCSRFAMADNTPVDKGSKEATFAALTTDFGFDDKVKGLFLKGPMENLEDFRYYFADEKEIYAFVAAAPGPEATTSLEPEEEPVATLNRNNAHHRRWIQISRVRRAWKATRRIGLSRDNRRKERSIKPTDLIEKETLRKVKLQFWERYKAKYPVEVSPSDYLLSRCYREMEGRLLTVYNIQRVKTLSYRVTTTKKRKQDNHEKREAEETSGTHGVKKYMEKLHTYLLALSIAGSNKLQGAPVEEAFGSNSTKYVSAPLDVLQSYYFRASRAIMSVPEASRLAWLEKRDTEERATWASQFHNGNEPLGEVVKSVMEKGRVYWDKPIQDMVTPPKPVLSNPAKEDIQTFDEIPIQQWETLAGQARAKVESKPLEVKTVWRNPDVAESGGGFKVKKSQIAFPKQLKGVPLAPSSRDGKRYCVDFQYAKCQEGDSCQLGLHKCAAVFRGGRTCHGNHPGIGCRNTKRHAVPEEANPEESPAQRKMKMEEPEDQSEVKRARVLSNIPQELTRIHI